MPNGNGQDFATRVIGSLLIAAVIGAWGYGVTRASANALREIDRKIETVQREGVDRERRIEGQLAVSKTEVRTVMVEQAEFRAQVREALRIPRGN